MPPPTPTHAHADADEPKYRGVRKRKWGKWVSEIRLPNSRERIWLGSYDSPEKAARAFDAALFCLRGSNANFNFPHQPPNIPGGTDLHPSQIQAVAAAYANSYSPPQSQTTTTTTSMEMEMEMEMDSTSFLMDTTTHPDAQDYDIFPGFDDYFMPMHPPFTTSTADQSYGYGEEVFDGSQDPSYLWNF